MYLAISIAIFVLCVWKRNSKIIFIVALAWLWYLMACSTGLADDLVNYNRYYSYLSFTGSTELGYYYIMRFFSQRGLDFLTYRKIVALFEMIIIGSTTWKLSRYPNIPIALYLIFPFCMDVVQMRNTLGLFIAIFGFRFLFLDDATIEGKKKRLSNDAKFAICIVVASLFHFINIIYLVFLFGKHYKTRRIIIVTAIICFFVTLMVSPSVLLSLGEQVGLGNKISAAMTKAASSGDLYRLTLFRVIVYFVMFVGLWLYDDRLLHHGDIHKIDSNLVLNCNVLIMTIIPLMQYSPDFYRCQIGLSLINYIYFVDKFQKNNRFKIKKTNIILALILIVSAIINLYLLVLGNNNIHTVFEPIFFGEKVW